MHPTHLFILFCRISDNFCRSRHNQCSNAVVVFSRGKRKSLLPKEWLIIPAFVFLSVYFKSDFTAHIALFSPLCLLSYLLVPSHISVFGFFCLFCPFLLPSLLICVAKILPWGCVAFFTWGPVVTFKACNVVCRSASGQLSLFGICTALHSGSRKTCLHLLAVIVHVYLHLQICNGLTPRSFESVQCLKA